MKVWKGVALAFAGVLLCGVAFVPRANANEWNKKTLFTFSEPVEVSGMILPAGQYVFQLMDSPASRLVVEIFNKDQTYCYGMLIAIPDSRVEATDSTVVTLKEQPGTAVEALDEWFYPGDLYGLEFAS